MASLRVRTTHNVEETLRRLNPEAVPRLVARMRLLGDDCRPQGSRQLAGSNFAYRLQVGDYRILYEVDEPRGEVIVRRIAHRREGYERLPASSPN